MPNRSTRYLPSAPAKSQTRLFRNRWLAVILAASGASTPALATDYTWTGASSNTFNSSANWGGPTPVNAATTAIFFGTAPAGRYSPNLGSSVTLGSITFNVGAGAFTISRTSPFTITLATGGSVTNNSTTLQTISAAIVLSGPSTWNATAGSLNISGAISGAGASLTKTGSETLTLSGANTYSGGTTISAGTLTVGNGGKLGTGGVTNSGILAYNSTGAITEANVIGGTGSLLQSGTGTTSLTATNTYEGGTTISGGALQFFSGSLGSGAVALNGGALRWAAGNTSDVSGVLTLAGGALDTNGNNVTLATALAGSGPLIKAGTGVLTLNAAPVSVTGATVNGGTLRAGAAGALPAGAYTVAGSVSGGSATLDFNDYDSTIGALTLGGASSAANAVNTVATGAGLLTLGGNVSYSATNNPGMASFTGRLDLGAATRTFAIEDSTNAAIDLTIGATISGAGVGLNKTGAGTLALTGTNTHTGGTTVSYGALQFSSSANFGSGPVTVNGFYSILRWAPGNTDGVAGGISIAGGYGRLDTNGNDVTLAAPLSGSGWMTKEGTGILTLASAPALTQARVQNGTLRLSADNALAAGAKVTVAGTLNDTGVPTVLDLDGHDLTIASLDLGAYYSGRNAVNIVTTGAGTLTLGGDLTYAIEGTPNEYYDPGTAVVAGHLNLGASTRTFNIADSFNTTLELNVTADISGAGGLTKTGPGNLVLSGANTYAGNTTISAGLLRGVLPTTGSLLLNGGVLELPADRSFVSGTGAGQVQWTGGGFSAFGGNRTVDIKDGSGTSQNLVWGSGTFIADGNSLLLSSAISDSTISLNNNIDFNNAIRTVNVQNGSAAIDASLNGVLSNGGLAVTGAGTLKLTGANTYAGGTTVDSGLEFSSGSLGTGSVRINDNGRLRWASGNTDSLAGMALSVGLGVTLDTNGNNVVLNTALGGNGNMIKAGNGILTLNAASPGATAYVTVLDGTVRFGVANALGATSYGIINVNGQTSGGAATFDTNGQNFGIYSLTFGGTDAKAGVINRVSTGTGTLSYTVGADISYLRASTAANDPGAAFLSGNLAILGAVGTFAVEDSSKATEDLTVSANISNNGNFGISKTGAGTLVLSGNNTYAGTTTLSGGALVLGSNTALSIGTLALANGTTIRGDGTARTLANNVTFTGTGSSVSGSSDLTLGTLTNVQAGNPTLTISNTGTTTFSALNLANSGTANRTVTLSTGAGANAVITGVIANGGTSTAGLLTKTGLGTLTLSGVASTYAGKTTIANGTLVAAKLANLSATSSLGAPTTPVSGTIDIGSAANSATLRYTGATATTNRIINLAGTTGGATLDASGTGAITFSSAFTAATGGSKILTLAGTNTDANTISAAIIDNSGTNKTSLVKTGVGTWVLGGTSTYTGATTINGGRLVVDGALSASSAIAINSGGTLGGHGTVGAITINSGGLISPGNSPGTMATGSETWAAGGGYVWELNAASDAAGAKGVSYDWLNITGALDLAATSSGKFTITVTSLTGSNLAGLTPGFLADASYQWIIATTTGNITNFDADKIQVDTSSFLNAPNTTGFTVSQSGKNIVLSYAPVPEPSAYAVAICGLLGVVILLRRRHRV